MNTLKTLLINLELSIQLINLIMDTKISSIDSVAKAFRGMNTQTLSLKIE